MDIELLCIVAFYAKHKNQWNSYDSSIENKIMLLVDYGFLEVNDFLQARFTGKTML